MDCKWLKNTLLILQISLFVIIGSIWGATDQFNSQLLASITEKFAPTPCLNDMPVAIIDKIIGYIEWNAIKEAQSEQEKLYATQDRMMDEHNDLDHANKECTKLLFEYGWLYDASRHREILNAFNQLHYELPAYGIPKKAEKIIQFQKVKKDHRATIYTPLAQEKAKLKCLLALHKTCRYLHATSTALIEQSYEEARSIVLDHNLFPDIVDFNDQKYLLKRSINMKDFSTAKLLMKIIFMDLNTVHNNGETLLTHALQQYGPNQLDKIENLLACGASPDAPNRKSELPIELTTDAKIKAKLIKAGGDPTGYHRKQLYQNKQTQYIFHDENLSMEGLEVINEHACNKNVYADPHIDAHIDNKTSKSDENEEYVEQDTFTSPEEKDTFILPEEIKPVIKPRLFTRSKFNVAIVISILLYCWSKSSQNLILCSNTSGNQDDWVYTPNTHSYLCNYFNIHHRSDMIS